MIVRVIPTEGSGAAGSSSRGAEALRVGYVPAIDGLRTVAVLAVIIFHLGIGLIPGGFVGVDVFFVISGFVVAASVLTARFQSFPAFIAFFYARRILRIMPALLVCLLVTFVASAMFMPPVWLSATNESTGRAAAFGLSNIVLALNSDTYFSPRAEFNPFTHTWSLGVEEQFYLIFPLLWFFWVSRSDAPNIRQRVVLAVAVLSLLSFVACAVLSITAPRMAFYMIFSRFWELGLGVVLASSTSYWLPRLGALSVAQRAIFTWGAVALLVIALALAEEVLFPFPWAVMPVVATGMLICAVLAWPASTVSRWLACPPVVYLGRRSYSLYLWHWPIFVLMRWTVGLEGAWQIAFALASTFVAAWASFRFVEEPFRHSTSLRGLPRVRIVVAGLLCMIMAAAVFTGVSRAKPYLLLSVTRDMRTWFPDRPLAGPTPCKAETSTQRLAGGELRRIEPVCDDARREPTVFVFGDSHAGAYRPLLTLVAAENRGGVELFTRSGCSFFRLNIPNSETSQACSDFARAAMQQVAASAQPGDVLFLPSLRMDRYSNQWGEIETASTADAMEQVRRRERAVAEAASYLKPLVAKGVKVIVEAPKPLFRIPPFRCSDWFNASNSVCAAGPNVARAELDERARPAREAIAALEVAVPTIQVWNPFPVLCPGEVCSAYAANGKPLFFDGDHLSGYGNEVLRDSFQQAFDAVLPAR